MCSDTSAVTLVQLPRFSDGKEEQYPLVVRPASRFEEKVWVMGERGERRRSELRVVQALNYSTSFLVLIQR
jgi:hypothetical protein